MCTGKRKRERVSTTEEGGGVARRAAAYGKRVEAEVVHCRYGWGVQGWKFCAKKFFWFRYDAMLGFWAAKRSC